MGPVVHSVLLQIDSPKHKRQRNKTAPSEDVRQLSELDFNTKGQSSMHRHPVVQLKHSISVLTLESDLRQRQTSVTQTRHQFNYATGLCVCSIWDWPDLNMNYSVCRPLHTMELERVCVRFDWKVCVCEHISAKSLVCFCFLCRTVYFRYFQYCTQLGVFDISLLQRIGPN